MSYAAEEQYITYEETRRKARKDHRCSACDRTIAKGHYYMQVYTFYADGGDAYRDHYKRCGPCQRTHEHLRSLCRELSKKSRWDNFWPAEDLSCGLDYAEEWGGEPPEDIARLPLLTDEEAGQILRKDCEG